MNRNSFSPDQRKQLFRFCLYGFLKNQQYFDPFLILAFRYHGFTFTAIGVLIAFRALCINFFEIPSGAAADVWGRRRSMILSMASYIAAFTVFALAAEYWMFFPAMFFFSVGEAFRTGTHKAIIFDWLEEQGMKDRKTEVYGLTRSWSKQGAALNSIIAALIYISTQDFTWVFLASAIPYLLNIGNFLFYPRYLDGRNREAHSLSRMAGTLLESVKYTLFTRGLRNLIVENICFEGVFTATRDYLQPTVKALAFSLPVLLFQPDNIRMAVLVGVVYFILNQANSIAARLSHRAAAAAGSEQRLTRIIWAGVLFLYAVMGAGFLAETGAVAVTGFVLLYTVLNVWKPVLVSRFHSHAHQRSAATILSVANQSKSLSVVLIAPLLGRAVDFAAGASLTREALPLHALWPVALLGCAAALIGLTINARSDK